MKIIWEDTIKEIPFGSVLCGLHVKGKRPLSIEYTEEETLCLSKERAQKYIHTVLKHAVRK
jgi:hypothetical protein